MKKILVSALLFGGISLLWGLDLASGGKACVRIVVDPGAERLEKMAAADLKIFLEEMTGAKFEIIPEDRADKSGPRAIYLGGTKFAAENGFPRSSLKDEEWVLKTVGNDLIVTGAPPVGTFYGVWDLLNRLGVYVLAPEANVVPKKKDVSIGTLDVRRQPAFMGRMLFTDVPVEQTMAGISEEVKDIFNLFTLRTGVNHWETHRLTPLYIGRYYRSPKRLSRLLCHTLCKYVDPKKYFKDHPEYFAMNEKGERFCPPFPYIREGSLCMSNPAVAQITLDSLREMIREDRAGKKEGDWPIRYDLSILDNMPYVCKCPECTKISREEESECGLFLRYVNFVADAIAKEYPDVLIKISAYSAVRKVPKITRPAKNIIVSVSDEFPQSDAFRPLTHPINSHRLKALTDWAAVSAHIAVGDYWNMGRRYFNPPRTEVVLDAVKPDLELFKKLGGMGLFIEYERDIVVPQPFYDLHVFVGTQLMMDLDRDVEKLVDIFLEGYYGKEAAPALREYLDELRRGVKTHPGRQTVLSPGRWHFYNAKFALRNYLKLKKAASLYPEGSPFRRRIEENMISLIWCSLLSRREFRAEFKKAGIDIDSLIPECKRFVDAYIHRWGAKKPVRALKNFRDRFGMIESNLPRPAKFKNVPEENIRIAGTMFASPYTHMGAAVVDDPDSITGKAMRSFGPSEEYHRIDKIRLKPGFRLSPRKYCLGNSAGKKDSISLTLKDEDIAKDEKYHWYRLPGKLDLSEKVWFWGQCWAIQFKMSSFYVLSDGVADNNVWNCWFSAKFTGPAYVPGSKKKNAVYVDMIVLTRPGTGGIE
ncbi:MAG: DUF4838 domain-containing protein [Lentisphaeria bacterium]|nr:DUF4838 domain-containing protein [Lentisphaeria bacterium]